VAVVVVATAGSASANSYVTLAEAESYFESRLNVTAWSAATTDTKNRAIVQATRHLDSTLDWVGERSSTSQALAWPRTGVLTRDEDDYLDDATIPQVLKDATCEQALAELGANRASDPGGRGLQRVQAGDVEVEFDGPTASVQYVLADLVVAMLAPWIASQTAGVGFTARYLARA
jgi:hypothetical protein